MATREEQAAELDQLDKAELISITLDLREQIANLSAQFQALANQVFKTGRERIDPNQLYLPGFAGSGDIEEEAPPTPSAPEADRKKKPKGHGRSEFPASIPRREIVIDFPKDERSCDECGERMKVIGEEVSERADLIPAQLVINRRIRVKRACPKGHGVKIPPPAPAVIDKGKYEPSVLAHVAVAKYGDHLPLHRLSGMFKRWGMSISKSTLWDLVARVAELVADPILAQMRRELLVARIIHADETPVTARLEDQKGSKKAYVWTYLSGDKILFDFTMSRERDGPMRFLGDWNGTLVADAYSGYDAVVARNEITRAGCWAHVRRRLKDALETGQSECAKLLLLVGRLFRIERALRVRRDGRGITAAEFHVLRQEVRSRLSRRVLSGIETELNRLWSKRSVTPKSMLGKALGYLERQWNCLVQFLANGELEIHNNDAERALRSVAVGRKNWMVFGSPRGGEVACQLYSLILSCKALGVDPEAYIADVLEKVSETKAKDVATLTPWAWAAAPVDLSPAFAEA